MPLSMQADELPPGDQNVVWRGALPRAPDRGRRDRGCDALGERGEIPRCELGLYSCRVERRRMRRDVDERGFQPLSVAMPEFQRRQLLQMIVQQPGMIERGLQDQRLAPRKRAAMAAVHRTVRELLADDDVRRVAAGTVGTALKAALLLAALAAPPRLI